MLLLEVDVAREKLALLGIGLHLEVQQLRSQLLYLDQFADSLSFVKWPQLIVEILVSDLIEILLNRLHVSLQDLQTLDIMDKALIDLCVL